MKKRPYGSDLAVIGYALVFLALGLLIAYCVRISPDVPPTPTPTAAPVATMTSTPQPTVTASIAMPVVRQTPAPALAPRRP
jgi:Na+-transporting methylmalonyl-CoA/oxaloacetate decarboxylase gamma subunit